MLAATAEFLDDGELDLAQPLCERIGELLVDLGGFLWKGLEEDIANGVVCTLHRRIDHEDIDDAGRAGLRVFIVPGEGPCLAPDATGVDGALAELLGISARAVADGTWERFKACPRDVCRWAFYDRSKNRSKKWCDMDSCGNVEKARSYRKRHAHA